MLDTRNSIVRWIGFSVLILLAVTLQIMVFPRINALPVPLVSAAAVVSLAVFAGTAGGAASGFVCGLLCDSLLPHTEAFFALTLMGAGALTGFLCGRGKILQRGFLAALVMSAVSVIIIKSVYILFFQVAAGRAPIGAYFTAGLPSMLASIFCVPLIYPLFRLTAKGFSGDD
jgi:rod shape-determining protein MreD